MKYFLFSLIVSIVFFSCNNNEASKSFVKVENGAFVIDNTPNRFIGVNYWYAPIIAAKGKSAGRERLKNELDFLKQMGITNLRVQACSEGDSNLKYAIKPPMQYQKGVFDEDILDGLDFFMSELSKRDMYAVLVLNNYWPWSGGMAQYLVWSRNDTIPFPTNEEPDSWSNYMDYTNQFYADKHAIELYRNTIKKLILRKNNYTGILYKDDSHIFSWQLANEPRAAKDITAQKELILWCHKTAEYIKTLDTNHLISIGSEGSVGHFWNIENYATAHKHKAIDYLTFHIWPQNWNWYNPFKADSTLLIAKEETEKYIQQHLKIAKKLNKPIVLEEFGLSRDNNSYEIKASLKYRNQYFKFVFDQFIASLKDKNNFSGLNLWAYAGEGIPENPGEMWEIGNSFIGDPPHELQGWYSIYNSDTTTINLIKTYINKLEKHN